MSWLNPWKEIRRLKADLAESAGMERSLRDTVMAYAKTIEVQQDRIDRLQDKNFSLTGENMRLGGMLRNAVFRDPNTGRLMPKGKLPA